MAEAQDVTDRVSARTGATTSPDDAPPHRYDAALAAEIEARWQARWDAEHTFEAPNPAGPLADPERVGGRPKLFLLDMFPYPSGAGLHVGHPLGYIGTDVFGRYRRMKGFNVLHTLGYDAFGLPAEQYAIETGTHPQVRTEQNIVTYRRAAPPARPGARPQAFGLDHRRVLLPLDPVDLPADLRVLVRPRPGSGPPHRRAARGTRGGHACHARWPPLGRAHSGRAAQADRRPPAGLHRRGARQLVPRPGNRPGQRGGHRRRAQRPRQLPGLSPEHAPVDDADHGLRRPPHR